MPHLRGVHILVLEDDPDAREIVSTAVTDAGGSVTAVASVAEALGTLRDRLAERPQAVVADIGLPGADGYTFISELRRMPPEEGGALPVIAVDGLRDERRSTDRAARRLLRARPEAVPARKPHLDDRARRRTHRVIPPGAAA